MKLRARMIAAMAVTVSFMPTGLLQAQGTASPSSSAMYRAVDSPVAPGSTGWHGDTPRFELFLGYSYFRGVPTLATGNRMVDLNGGDASLAFNLNRYLGLVADFAGYDDTQLRLTGPGANPARVADSSGTAYTYLFGPRVSFRNNSRVTPFVQALFGGVHASEVTLSHCTGPSCTPLPTQNAFAMTAGGGIDVRMSRHISLRPVQAEYMMTRFANPITGASNTQNDLRLSAGLLFRFGGHKPLPPPPPPPAAPEQPSPAPEAVVKPAPPTVTCSANPSFVNPGDSSTITANGTSTQNLPLTYSYISTAGSISGAGSTAILSTAGAPSGMITVTCNVVDSLGQSAAQTTSVTVATPAAAPKPSTSNLCVVNFTRDARRPTRVDNEAKACLDDIALNLQHDSDATLAIVGNAASGEKGRNRLASERAVNTKAYLVTEKGIDSSRIAVYSGSQDGKTVSSTLIPIGATFDTTGDTPVDESAVKAHPRTPRQHRQRSSPLPH